MHPARHDYLAYAHPVKRTIVSRERNAGGHWVLALECGHTGECVGHMDASLDKDWKCWPCSMERVRVEFADEFATEVRA